MRAQRLAGFGDERAFVGVDRVERELFDPVHRGMQADRADDVRRARLRTAPADRGTSSPRTSPSRSSLRRPATAAWRRAARRGPRGSRCRSGRKACARRRRRSRRRCAATSTGRRGTAWQPSSSSSAPLRMRDLGGALRVEDRAEHVRHMREGDDAMLFGQHRLRRVEVDLAVGRQRHRVDFVTGELPRHDVAVMLELREQDAVAAVLRQRARDQVDRLGRAAGEDQLVRLAADQVRRRGARSARRRRSSSPSARTRRDARSRNRANRPA